VADAFIFVLAGMIASKELLGNEFEQILENLGSSWTIELAKLLGLYVVLHLIRALVVFSFLPLFPRLGTRLNVKEAIMISYSGMRGAVGLALGLMLKVNGEEWYVPQMAHNGTGEHAGDHHRLLSSDASAAKIGGFNATDVACGTEGMSRWNRCDLQICESLPPCAALPAPPPANLKV
jgi:hypothetical protein